MITSNVATKAFSHDQRGRALVAALVLVAVALLVVGYLMGAHQSILSLWSKSDPAASNSHPEANWYQERKLGVKLADFESYQAVSTVQKALESREIPGGVISGHVARPSSQYPPYRIDYLLVEDYLLLDSKGAMNLSFLNDRLYQVEFTPEEPFEFAPKLSRYRLKRDANARAEKVEGHQRIMSTVGLATSDVGVHLRSKPYVLWQDLRLIEQVYQWDRDYGMIPKDMDVY